MMTESDFNDPIVAAIRAVLNLCPDHKLELVPLQPINPSAPKRLVCPIPTCNYMKLPRLA